MLRGKRSQLPPQAPFTSLAKPVYTNEMPSPVTSSEPLRIWWQGALGAAVAPSKERRRENALQITRLSVLRWKSACLTKIDTLSTRGAVDYHSCKLRYLWFHRRLVLPGNRKNSQDL